LPEGDGLTDGVGSAVEVTNSVEPLDRQRQGGQQLTEEQAVGLRVADMLETVAVFGPSADGLKPGSRSPNWNEETKEYGDELKTKRPSTQRDMKNAMRKILVARFGDRRMDSIKTGEIQAFLMSLIGSREKGKISRQTALKYKIYLNSMFSAAIRLECGVIRNPVRSVRLTVEEPAKPSFVLDDLQTPQIAESLEDPRHKMMWSLNLWMGNRIGETRALRWKCIDWETGRVIVTESLFEGKSNKPKTKAGEGVAVLNEAQLTELREHKQKHYPDAEPEG
jgi:integrase